MQCPGRTEFPRQELAPTPARHQPRDLDHPDASVRLETRPLAGQAVFLDLAVTTGASRIAFELKYLVRALNTVVGGERFELRAQSAHDVRRYDVVKDIHRLEVAVAADAATVGYAVVLSNDAAYWTTGTKANPVDMAYRLHEGRNLRGRLAWGSAAGSGTTAKREEPVVLVGTYNIGWSDYSDLNVGSGGRFRYLLVEVSKMRESQV